MNHRLKKIGFPLLVIAGLAVVLSACGSTTTTATDAALAGNQNLQKKIYAVHNNVEFNNYNARQLIADDPTTILWCTAYSNNPNVKPMTFPIVGKLTSSAKRPYPTQQIVDRADYNPELPGPDKMYGSSTEYRYGFTPGGVYVDFTDIPTVCSTQPLVYQATETTVVLKVDAQLNAAANAARQALADGKQANGTISAAGSKAAAAALAGATK